MQNNYETQQNPLNFIPEGSEAYVRGKVDYCRIAKQIEGEALARDMASRQQRGREPIERPYTTLTLKDPMIVPVSKDVNNLTPLEALLANTRFYASQKDTSKRFTGENKGNSIPKAAHLQDGKYHAVILQNELEQGSDVMIKVRVFKPKTRRNHGLAMDAVMVMDPAIKYWAPAGDIASSIAAAGLGEWVEMSPEEEARQKALAGETLERSAPQMQPQMEPPQTNYQSNAYHPPLYGQNQGFSAASSQEATMYSDPGQPTGNGISMPL